MAKLAFILCLSALLLLSSVSDGLREQPLRDHVNENPENGEDIVGLHDDNKDALSVKDKLESDHFMPKNAIKSAIIKCQRNPRCKNSDIAKKLDKMLNLDLTMTLTKNDHGQTKSYGTQSEEVADELVRGNFKQAFALCIKDYHEVFGNKHSQAISKILAHNKEQGILEGHEYDQLLNENHHLQRVQVNYSGRNSKSVRQFNRENEGRSNEETKHEYANGFAQDRIANRGAKINRVLGNPNAISQKKATILRKAGISVNGYSIKRIVN